MPFGHWWKILIAKVAFLLCLGLPVQHAAAQSHADAKAVEDWADRYLGGLISEKRSAGATVSVVQDGKMLFSKGYGYADYPTRSAMDPDRSGVLVGSITKTFVATAVAQLVDQGRIKSLDDPVNRYLRRIKLPGEYGAQVTVRHLLTHRAGFEEFDFGMLTNRKDIPVPLAGSEISRYMPKIVLRPGSSSNYSNWGFSLLGFMVEDITGERLDTYLKNNIWLPLGMTQTSLIYDRMPKNLSRNYWFEKDGTPVADIPVMPHPWIAPSGTVVSTANDMAKFMNAHILKGEGGAFPLVSERMYRELHTETFRNGAVGNGFALAFWTYELSGSPTIEHGGSTPGFQNMMVISPDKRFGIFVSVMTSGLVPWDSYDERELASGKASIKDPINSYVLRHAIVKAFFKRTREIVPAVTRKTPRLDPSAFVGTYVSGRRNVSDIQSLIGGINPVLTLRISLTEDKKGLMLNGYGPYRQIENGVFSAGTAGYPAIDRYNLDLLKPPLIAFNVSPDGRVMGLVPGLAEQMYLPASPVFNPQVMAIIGAFAALMVMCGAPILLWPQPGRLRRPASILAVAATCLVVAFAVIVTAGFEKGDSLLMQAAMGEKTRFFLLVAVANLLAVIAAAMAVMTIREWRNSAASDVARWLGTAYRVHLTVVTLAAMILSMVLYFFNFLGLQIPG